jgi:phenylacetate-CoA ligase
MKRPFCHEVSSRLYDRLSGRRLWRRLRCLQKLQWHSREDLDARADAKLRLLVRHAYEHVPYYRELFDQANIAPSEIQGRLDLAWVPITEKAQLRASFPMRAVADNLPTRQRQQGITSGSTGFPLEFYTQRSSLDLRFATAFLFDEWLGCAPGDIQIRIGSGIASLGRLARLRQAAWWAVFGGRVVPLDGMRLTTEQFRNTISRLPARGRYCIMSSPSYLARLGVKLLEERTELPAYPIVVVIGAETPTEADVRVIGRAFRCPVRHRYGCHELGFIAQSCPDQPAVLHSIGDHLIVRVVMDEGGNAAPGASGRVVVTDLSNWVMPFINYDLGDRATAGAACACGRGLPTIMQVEGRSGEVIRTLDGRIMPPTALGLNKFPRALKYLWEYQAIQTAPDTVVFRVVPTPRFTAEFCRELETWLAGVLGPGMRGTVETVDQIPAERSGKRLIIKSHLSR